MRWRGGSRPRAERRIGFSCFVLPRAAAHTPRARQSGGVDFRIARFPDDTDLLAEARALARAILDLDPALDRRENKPLKERAVARYPKADVLFRVG